MRGEGQVLLREEVDGVDYAEGLEDIGEDEEHGREARAAETCEQREEQVVEIDEAGVPVQQPAGDDEWNAGKDGSEQHPASRARLQKPETVGG